MSAKCSGLRSLELGREIKRSIKIKGFEVMRALRKDEARMFAFQDGIVGGGKIVERAFGIGSCALTGTMD